MENTFEHSFIPLTTFTSGIGQAVTPDLFCLPIQIVNVCYVGDSEHSSDWVLIDAGMPRSAHTIIQAAEQRFGCAPKAIILTHGHFDHVGAIVKLIEKWRVPVYAHEMELPFLTGKANYPPGDPTVDGGMVSKISPLFPNEGINLDQHIHVLPADGSVPDMHGWRWIHTPGHTPGHISLFKEQDRLLIAGDAFVTVKQESLYKVITQEIELSGPPKYFTTDWQAAWESVKKLEKLQPALAVTGHGLPMYGERLTKDLAYLAQNFDRMAIPEEGRFVH
jgi:glyoxylase-like metal-dependent hydrolase (beta-lactamase superfamily II)